MVGVPTPRGVPTCRVALDEVVQDVKDREPHERDLLN